jgi:hypothetical protein
MARVESSSRQTWARGGCARDQHTCQRSIHHAPWRSTAENEMDGATIVVFRTPTRHQAVNSSSPTLRVRRKLQKLCAFCPLLHSSRSHPWWRPSHLAPGSEPLQLLRDIFSSASASLVRPPHGSLPCKIRRSVFVESVVVRGSAMCS